MQPTIKDVAQKAGVSIATVSLVLHNHERISPATKKKVLKAIKELDYHPSRSAAGLVTKKTGNIGFILTDDHFLKTEPFYTRIFLGTEFVTRGNEYYVLLATIDRDFKEGSVMPRFIRERSVDGIIINLASYHLPTVFVDFFPINGDHNVVLIDNLKGGYQATKHLIDLGHHEIGFIGADIKHPSILERLNGYRQALQNAGIEIKNENIDTNEDYPARQNGYDAAQRLFNKNKNITAIFACNDAMAIGVMHYASDKGVNIPDDLSLVGFDDVEADLFLNPPLTTIRVPKIELGTEAMQLLADVIKNKNMNYRKMLVPIELIIRKSTKELTR